MRRGSADLSNGFCFDKRELEPVIYSEELRDGERERVSNGTTKDEGLPPPPSSSKSGFYIWRNAR